MGDLNDLAPPPDASCQVSKSQVFWFWRRGFLKVFAFYTDGVNLGHVTWTFNINFCSPFLIMHHMKFGFYWLNDFRDEDL